MKQQHKILALTLARGGSKGLPGKNIRLLAGKPLIAWTIEAAVKSGYFERVIVSTDDEKIAKVSKEYGADAPFIRPAELAKDDSKYTDTVFHAFDWLKENDKTKYTYFMLLQATSPMRSIDDIKQCIDLLDQKKAKAIVSVKVSKTHPGCLGTIPKDGCLKDFKKGNREIKNRQEYQEYYAINGAIYLSEIEYFKKNNGFLGDETYAYVMPEDRSIDIDDVVDFNMAEALLLKTTDCRCI